MNEEPVFAISRPSPELLKLYVVWSILSGPGIFVVLPVLLIRYFTLRYHFDEKGISMRWGFIIRREVNLAYSRIQDIHLTSGIIQRWFGLADIMIQTASGNAAAEMKIEGLPEYEYIRSFIYSRMRGYRDLAEHPVMPTAAAGSPETLAAVLEDIRRELQGAREGIELFNRRNGAEDHHV